MPRVDFDAVVRQAAASVPLLRDSFGRSGTRPASAPRSSGEGNSLFLARRRHRLRPGADEGDARVHQAPYVKEAHNDYLATLLERGLIGASGCCCSASPSLARCGRLLGGRCPRLRGGGATSLAPGRLGPVMAVAGGFYEVLHFRHLWTWLGIVAALVLVACRPPQEEPP